MLPIPPIVILSKRSASKDLVEGGVESRHDRVLVVGGTTVDCEQILRLRPYGTPLRMTCWWKYALLYDFVRYYFPLLLSLRNRGLPPILIEVPSSLVA